MAKRDLAFLMPQAQAEIQSATGGAQNPYMLAQVMGALGRKYYTDASQADLEEEAKALLGLPNAAVREQGAKKRDIETRLGNLPSDWQEQYQKYLEETRQKAYQDYLDKYYADQAAAEAKRQEDQLNATIKAGDTPGGGMGAEGRGGPGTSGSGPEGYGPMGPTESAVVGVLGALSPSIMGVNPFGVMSLASQLADLMGVQPTEFAPSLSPADIQGLTDAFGAYAGAQAEAAAREAAADQAAREAAAEAMARETEDPAESALGPGSAATLGDPVSEPGVRNPDSPETGWGTTHGGYGSPAEGSQRAGYGGEDPSGFGVGVGPGGTVGGPGGTSSGGVGVGGDSASGTGGADAGGSGGTGGTGAGDSGSGGGPGGEAGGRALGGVDKVNKPTRVTFGEYGPETAIFIPEHMKRPGLQPKEASVIRALDQLLRELRG